MPKQIKQAPSASPFDVLARRKTLGAERPDAQTRDWPSTADVQTAELPVESLTGRGGKRSDPDFQKCTVYVLKTTHRSAKAIAGLQGRELSDVVEDLLKAYIREHQESALKNL